MPTPLPRLPRRGLLTLPAALAALGLTSCSAGTEHPATAGAPAHLTDVTVLKDPIAYQGPSTAHLTHSGVRVIAENPQPRLPLTVTDTQGTKVRVTDVSRILAIDLYGSCSRIVYDLGLGANIVGRDISSQFAEIKDKPLITQHGHELNGESILKLEPTVIITDTSLGPWDTILQMRDAGIPVVVVDSHRSIKATPTLIQQVADAVGLHEQGVALGKRTAAEISQAVRTIHATIPQGTTPLRMMFFYARGQSGTYYIFGEGSGADDLISSLGGVDVAKEIGWSGMKPMTDEAILDANPDLLLMMTKGLESCGGVDGLLDSIPAIALTPAGQRRRIVDMEDTDILSFGPTTAGVLEALSIAVYAPDAAKARS